MGECQFLRLNPNTCVPSREAVRTISIMAFPITLPGHETTTYRTRDGHANHKGTLKLSSDNQFIDFHIVCDNKRVQITPTMYQIEWAFYIFS